MLKVEQIMMSGHENTMEPSESNSSFESRVSIARAVVALLGSGIIAMALASYLTEQPLDALLKWLERMFSVSFILIFTLLITLGSYAIYQLKQGRKAQYWHEVGQQAGNGISTLALTYTLLGISLGIGTLSENAITPQNVQEIISGLTKQFSMAFMTTVVGLPAATIIRALVGIGYQKICCLNRREK